MNIRSLVGVTAVALCCLPSTQAATPALKVNILSAINTVALAKPAMIDGVKYEIHI